ncbi:WbqC-like protein [Gordoniibacillus kamchatkensis]|uniref:WbqC-like protein n=1 Tax=Gordoniibacillus kamchatkensis TaxID=1590651 RepID=A0ABR5AI85_9BACL|nr:WbqC-like protein [Paenibacillus sp. VKM B-2647]
MKIAIMQPYLFPYIGYYQLIHASDIFVIYDDANYINRGWINRNYILIQGKKHLFTLNLVASSCFKKINEIEIGDNSSKLAKTIKYSYGKAPFFENIFPIVEDILFYKNKNLADFISNSLKLVSEYLSIETKFIRSSSLPYNQEAKGQYKVIDICKKLNANMYMNPIGGKHQSAAFVKENLALTFLKPSIPHYVQFKNEFIPGLSMLDVLMFNSKEDIRNMLEQYTLESET